MITYYIVKFLSSHKYIVPTNFNNKRIERIQIQQIVPKMKVRKNMEHLSPISREPLEIWKFFLSQRFKNILSFHKIKN